MKLLISYRRNRGDKYQPLWKALFQMGAVRRDPSVWELETTQTPTAIGNALQRHCDAGDRIDVYPVAPFPAAYHWPATQASPYNALSSALFGARRS